MIEPFNVSIVVFIIYVQQSAYASNHLDSQANLALNAFANF